MEEKQPECQCHLSRLYPVCQTSHSLNLRFVHSQLLKTSPKKPVSLSHLNVFAVFRCSAIPRPSLSTNCVVDCCFQSCGVSALRRPIRALGGFCASQWETATEKRTNENARGQKTEYTERSRQEACMKPMCQVQIEQNFWVGNFVICTGHDFTMRGIPSDNWCLILPLRNHLQLHSAIAVNQLTRSELTLIGN